MNQENNNTNSPRPNSEQRSRAEESLKDSLDDVIASLIDLDEDDASEESSASKNLMDTGLQMPRILILKPLDLLCLPNELLGRYRK